MDQLRLLTILRSTRAYVIVVGEPISLAESRCAQAPAPLLLVAGSRHRVLGTVAASPRRTPFQGVHLSQRGIRIAQRPFLELQPPEDIAIVLSNSFFSLRLLGSICSHIHCGGLGSSAIAVDLALLKIDCSVAAADSGETKTKQKVGIWQNRHHDHKYTPPRLLPRWLPAA